MSKAIVLSIKQWKKLRSRIEAEYNNVFMLRKWSRERLGFTHRRHEEWIEGRPNHPLFRFVEVWIDDRVKPRFQIATIHLDFYDESKRTMFLLKYSEYLHHE